jgi:ribose/xylose/arabinose/galactoside ABC-type transport system permease subunit
MGSVSRGLTGVPTNGMPVVNLPDPFGRLQDGNLVRVRPVPVAILVVLAIGTRFILKYTSLGQ